jgi:hypothetical protein
MRIGATSGGSSNFSGRMPREAASAPAEPQAESRALVTLAPPAELDQPSIHRQAPFLAQLIATKAQHPQTRQRRRAEPREAIAAYRAAAGLTRG